MKLRTLKSAKESLIEQCDSLFRQIILSERPHKCEWCGATHKPLQIAHILPKGTYKKLRYYRDNVLLLCFPCHPPRWHNNPLEAADFISRYKGQDYKNILRAKNEIMPKMDYGLVFFAFTNAINSIEELK